MALIGGQYWALQTIDSWGKLPSGILSGNLFELGNFDQCLQISETSFNGQYCLSTFSVDSSVISLPNSLIKTSQSLNHFPLTQTPINSDVNKNNDEPNNLPALSLMVGLCLPDTCSPEFIGNAAKIVLSMIQPTEIVSVQLTEKLCQRPDTVYSSMDIFAICFFSIIAAIMILSTIYDIVYTRQKKQKNSNLIAFSMYSNGEKIFKCTRSTSPNVIECINGVRVFSITWIVLSHTYSSYFLGSINMLDALSWTDHYHSVFISASTVAVDTFFLLSGLLVAWSLLKELDSKNGKLNVPLMYLHRYLRLTPALAAAILLYATLFRHINDGPIWPMLDPLAICSKSWWTTLLYVQNYVGASKFCIAQTWYLQIDMQLFIVSPLIVYPLWRWRNKFIWVIPILIALSMAYVFEQFMVYSYKSSIMVGGEGNRMESTYMSTHSRYGAWAVGVILGYILHNIKGKNVPLPKITIIIGWIISLGTILAIIFGFYNLNHILRPASDLANAFYESFSRVCWTIAVSWIIFACQHGYGGPINWFLTLPQWQPLSRLSYSIYLLHTIVQTKRLGSIKTTFFFSDYNAIHTFWGDFGLTCCMAILWTMAFESPILILEKLLVGNRSDKKRNESQENLTSKPTVHIINGV